MSEDRESKIRPDLRPKASDVSYDLDQVLRAVVSLRAVIPEDAFTAPILGTERTGHGVLIRESGLIVTIGYLVTEAEQLWIIGQNGQALAGHVVGYDYETGFGLVQALGKLDLPALELGSSAALSPGEEVVVAGFGGARHSLRAQVVAKREFAGYWEYLLDEAIFTAPPHPNWGGAGLITDDGRLSGIGSLYIQQVAPWQDIADGNMIVPIDILKPIMEEMLTYGTTLKSARPWLGMFTTEADGHLVIAGVYNDSPAELADVRAGDLVLRIGDDPVDELADFFRKIWALGDAGTGIPLTLHRDGSTFEVEVRSTDRRSVWKTPDLH